MLSLTEGKIMRKTGIMKYKQLFLFLLLFLSALSEAQVNSDFAKGRKYQSAKPLFGGNFSIGYGFLTEELGQYFTHPFLLPITGDFVYKNLTLQLNLDAGFSKVRQTMVFEDGSRWNKGDNAFHSTIGLNLGFSIFNTTKLRITPLVGWANIYISKKWWGSSDISEYEPHANYLNIALITDLKKIYAGGKTYSNNQYEGYGAIRLSAGVYMPLQEYQSYPNYYNGYIWYFSVGIAYLAAWDDR